MADLRDGETRDDTHASRNAAQLRIADDACPKCRGPTRREGGCRTCKDCGWSECGGGQP